MKNLFYKAIGLVILNTVSHMAHANNEQIDISPLIGDYVATNPGYETAAPVFQEVDANKDGKKDGYNFRFDVFKLGTQIKLFSTPVRYLAYSLDKNCVPTYSTRYWGYKRAGSNIILYVRLSPSCSNNSESASGHFYGVNLSAAGKVPWVKSFPGHMYGIAVLPDRNGNGVAEIGTAKFASSLMNNLVQNSTDYIFDGLTGAQLVTPQTYVFSR